MPSTRLPVAPPGAAEPARTAPFRSGLMRAIVALAVVGVTLFAAELGGLFAWSFPVGQLLNTVMAVLAVLMCRRAARDGSSSEKARRVWWLTTCGIGLVAASIGTRLVASTVLPAIAPVGNVFQVVGAVLLAWSVLRIPLSPRTRAQRAALVLDVATLLVAAATVVWHFFGASNGALTPERMRELGPVMGASLVAVLLGGRAALGGSDVVPPRAVYMRAVAALVGGFGTAISILILAAHPHIDPEVLLNCVATAAIAVSAAFQLNDPVGAATGRRRTRRYSTLPYAAILVVDLLLVRATVTDAPDHLVVAVAAVVLTALVVLRQLIAFLENNALLDRLGDHERRLRYEATHDPLTGLANRALFAERLATALTRPAGEVFSLVVVDLDEFKAVNDTLGHAAGDALLVSVAQHLRDGIRASDTVARLGGDEFAILVEGQGAADVEPMVERIARSLGTPLDVNGHTVVARASFGVVEGCSGDHADALMHQADLAMYEAKAHHAGVRTYRAGMESRDTARRRVAAELRSAVEQHELVLHYQPVVTLPDGRLTGVEALVRWQHPTRGLLLPADFIPEAEETGVIVELGRWVLHEATRQVAAWHADHGPDAVRTVAVNASARQLQEPTFAAGVAAALRESGLPPSALIIEITESTAVGGGATWDNLTALRDQGIGLSLDDFGTGRSTLSLLVDCAVDQIKLDRRFTPTAGDDAIAAAVLHLARDLDIEVVAEGVETPEQAQDLDDLGYGLAQGFHFARPMPPADVVTLLAARAPVALSR